MELTREQINLLERFNLPTNFSNLTDKQYFDIDDKMSHEMLARGINDTGDGLNDYGELCLSVIISLPDE